MKNTIKVGVGVYVFNKQHQLLLGLRKSTHAFGTWCAPGGHMEYGETNEEAAIRELKEETGLDTLPQDLTLEGVTNDFYQESGKHYITLHFICRHYTGLPKIIEKDKCAEWKWFSLDNLPTNLMLSNKNFLSTHKKY